MFMLSPVAFIRAYNQNTAGGNQMLQMDALQCVARVQIDSFWLQLSNNLPVYKLDGISLQTFTSMLESACS